MTSAEQRPYDAWHAALEPDEGTSEWHQAALALLEGDLQDRRVLEIGCGRGGFSRRLADLGAIVVGADFSESALHKARSAASRVEWRREDIQHLSFPDESFDIVVSCETIEHVPDPRLAVRELARVLRPGGTLVLTAPSYLGLLGLYRGYLRLRGRRFQEAGQPINQLTLLPRTVWWVCRAGLRVEAIRASGHYLPFPGRPPVRFGALDRWGSLRWFALHGALRARKAAGSVRR